MKRSLIAIVGLLVICTFSGWIVGRSNAPATTMSASRRIEIDAGMDRIVPEVSFQNTPLEKAIEILREQTKTNLVGDWNVIEASGIDPSKPISCRLTNLPLSRVLDVVGTLAAPIKGQLSAQVVDGVIEFSTTEALSKYVETRIYNVRDLIEASLKLHQKWNSIPQSSTAPQSPPSFDESINDLKKLITDTVEPDQWRDAGGSVGSITEFNGLLIITGTPKMLQEIDDLLAKIRKEG
jgi:hypothetical protein